MASEWQESTVAKEVDILLGFAFKSAEFTTEPPGHRLVRGDNVKRGKLEWGEKTRYWRSLTPDLERYILRAGDVVVGMDGSRVGENFARIASEDLPAMLVQRVACLRARCNLDQSYLRYLICNPEFTAYIKAVHTGTSIPHISGGQICEYPICLPPLDEQRAIAHILGTLDDKIELNRNMNQTLEAMARALFKSWFVDFDPVRAKMDGRWQQGESLPGIPTHLWELFPDKLVDSELGEIPEGWGVGSFSDTIDILGGGTPRKTVEEYWDGSVPWYSVVDAPSESDIWILDTTRHITVLGVEESSTKVLPIGTTILSARGTVGKLALVGVPMAMNQSCYGFRCKKGELGYFTYYCTRWLVDTFQQCSHGSVFNTITRDTLASIDVVTPTAQAIQAYEEVCRPLFERVRCGLLESRFHADIRDTLLPKLISGELRVKDAEQYLGNAI